MNTGISVNVMAKVNRWKALMLFLKSSGFCEEQFISVYPDVHIIRCYLRLAQSFLYPASFLKDIIWVLQKKKKCKSTHVSMAEEWKQERIWNVIISTLFLDFVSHPGFSSIENCFKNCSRQLAQKSCFQICS